MIMPTPTTWAMDVNYEPPKDGEDAILATDVKEISTCGELEVIGEDPSPPTSLISGLHSSIKDILLSKSHKEIKKCA